MKNDWLYDVEIYPNLFLIGAKVPHTDRRVRFQISPLADDRPAMARWMLEEVKRMIGYNILEYDYPVIHYLIYKLQNYRGRDAVAALYKKSQQLIKSQFNQIKNPIRPQIDLLKINHFDNKAKMVSLKVLEFNLRAKNIQSLPYTFDTVLNEQQIHEVIAYNDNDIDATEKVFDETLSELQLREKLSPMYGIDFTNFNSTKMGEHILIKEITSKLGRSVLYDTVETERGTKEYIRNTKRESIDLGEVVFDYIEFRTEPFQKVTQWIKNRTITETKGSLTEIPFEELKSLEPHYEVIKKKGKQQNLNVIYRNFRYDFGVGGIHGCTDAGIYEEDEQYEIRDIDVASYYPNLAIKNGFYPEHIGPEFCEVYQGIYEQRKKYPKKTHKTENLALKLALNGSYGKSNSEYSALCDPKYTMLTTINGQLLLCMAAEWLQERIPECQMLQINTDGLTIRYKKCYAGLVNLICSEWEELTQLELEHAYYSKMIIRDVNNYMAVYRDGEVKRKGAAFIHQIGPGELELHKNFSQLVVPKALEAYFINGTLPEDFFQQHDDLYDFFKRTKVPKSSRLVGRVYDEKLTITREHLKDNVSRYLITGKLVYHKDTKTYERIGRGETLIKIMPPLKAKGGERSTVKPGTLLEREFNVEEGWLCTVVNTLPEDLETLRHLICHDYYVQEAYKVIDVIENKNDEHEPNSDTGKTLSAVHDEQ